MKRILITSALLLSIVPSTILAQDSYITNRGVEIPVIDHSSLLLAEIDNKLAIGDLINPTNWAAFESLNKEFTVKETEDFISKTATINFEGAEFIYIYQSPESGFKLARMTLLTSSFALKINDTVLRAGVSETCFKKKFPVAFQLKRDNSVQFLVSINPKSEPLKVSDSLSLEIIFDSENRTIDKIHFRQRVN